MKSPHYAVKRRLQSAMDLENGRRSLMKSKKCYTEIECDRIQLLNYMLSDDEAGSKAAVLKSVMWCWKKKKPNTNRVLTKKIGSMFGAM